MDKKTHYIYHSERRECGGDFFTHREPCDCEIGINHWAPRTGD